MATIFVPIVASYPDFQDVADNAKRCAELGHNVILHRALKHKPYPKRHPSALYGEPWGDPELRAKSVLEHVPTTSAIIATPTGGSGSMRTITRISDYGDWNWAKNKIAIGFSDTTAFITKVAAISCYPSFHGPCFEDPEFIDVISYYTCNRWGWKIPFVYRDNIGKEEILNGTLWGGNLTMFNYMLGDADVIRAVKRDARILFLEDIYDPAVYGNKADVIKLIEMEFDRLEYAGIFRNTLAILMGRISDARSDRVLASLRKYYFGPVIGIDIGHSKNSPRPRPMKMVPPLPIGTNVRISLKGDYLDCQWTCPKF